MTKVIQNKGQIRNDYYETSCKTHVSVNYQIGIYSIMSSPGKLLHVKVNTILVFISRWEIQTCI